MKTAVYKYVLTEAVNEVVVPIDARFIHVANQREQICVWAEVSTDPAIPECTRTLYVVGTGHLVPEPEKTQHIGSALMQDGAFVFHIYEEKQQ